MVEIKSQPKTWRKVKIGDLVSPVSETFNFKNRDKIIFLNTSDVENGHVLNHTETVISTLPGQAKKKIKRGDILYSEIRPKNKHVARVNFDADDYVVSTKLIVLRPNEKFSADFTYLALMAPHTIRDFQTIAESRSGTFPQITFDAIKNYEVSIPNEYTKQQSIADILSAFDDKIELNNKISAVLEQMAQAIFKEWFVNFRFPGHEKAKSRSERSSAIGIKMVNSELGKIPEGWEVSYFGDEKYTETVSSGIDKFDEEKIYLATADVDGKEIINTKTKIKYKKRPSRADMQPIINSVWFAKMVNTYKVLFFFEQNKKDIEKYILSTGFMGVKCNKGSEFYIYLFISSEKFHSIKNTLVQGAVQEALTLGNIKQLKILMPGQEILIKFNQVIKPMISEMYKNKLENQKLAALRDLLLPKLMSGEVKV